MPNFHACDLPLADGSCLFAIDPRRRPSAVEPCLVRRVASRRPEKLIVANRSLLYQGMGDECAPQPPDRSSKISRIWLRRKPSLRRCLASRAYKSFKRRIRDLTVGLRIPAENESVLIDDISSSYLPRVPEVQYCCPT